MNMPLSSSIRRANILALICALVFAPLLIGQTFERSNRQDPPDVLRVYTDLVQTDVMVFDKHGRFVNGLKKEEFELRIDGKAKPLEFFERVTTGSATEESQLAAARGWSGVNNTKGARAIPLDRGRPIYFYIDDLHLDSHSLKTTQKLIKQFIDKVMGQNDEAAVASASGQIGFLRQLTDNKAVLRAAVERLKLRPYTVRDYENPPMTEYQSLLVENNDREVIDYFVDRVTAGSPGLNRDIAESMVKTRARALLRQAGNVTDNTLAGLEGLVRSADRLPGRKLVFFISDGFFLDDRNSDSMLKLRRITSAAARSGVVIYSLDSRGLVAGLPGAGSETQFDTTGRLLRAAGGELTASQDGLNALAKDTGGKAFFNSNSLEPALTRAIEETSTYYLLAWKPDREAQQSSKFRRIEVRVTGRSELTVQVSRGFFDIEPERPVTKAKNEEHQKPDEKTTDSELRRVISSPYPDRSIPVSLRLSYFNTPDKGEMLVAAMQVPKEFLSFAPAKGKQAAGIAVRGTVFNDKGQVGAGFNKQLTILAPPTESGGQSDVVYGYSVFLTPGLYQVRVAARDDNSGRTGSAHAWIEIPNFAAGELALSSMVLGSRAQPAISNASATADLANATELRVGQRFSPNDFLRFMLFIYNPKPDPAGSKPDVALQVQVVRDGQPVVTGPLAKLSVDGVEDLKRIPYAAEIALQGLPSGRYLLQVAVIDRVARRSATKQARFEIE
jgi:VWFA-related protein